MCKPPTLFLNGLTALNMLIAFSMVLAGTSGCTADSSSNSTSNGTSNRSIQQASQINSSEPYARDQSLDFTKPGRIDRFTYDSGVPMLGTLDYLVYTPSSYNSAEPAPLVLVIHGCNTTADEMIASSAIHPTAEREGFIAVYPHVPAQNEPTKCWQWFSPLSQMRDSGDPALLVGVTREVTARMNIDKERVYALGMSSGAMMTSVLGATYPDVFAAIGENAGCAYMAGIQCLKVGPVFPDEFLGQQAFSAMGKHARVMPVLQLRGDMDKDVPMANSSQVLGQWISTNNYVISGSSNEPFDREADTTFKGKKVDGYDYTVNRYHDEKGCLLFEDWTVHGMGHFFSGGSTASNVSAFTDPKGPRMAEIAWQFFSRYRLSDFKGGYKPSAAACE